MSSNVLIPEKKERLDKFLMRHIDASRNQIEHLIKKGFVTVEGEIVNKAGYKVAPGVKVEYLVPENEERRDVRVDMHIRKLYEDEHILVVDKPAGLVVHPAPSVKEATLVDWLKSEGVTLSTISGEERHGIVHRLDKFTSGAMVIAKDNRTHENLSRQLQTKSVGRYYIAVVDYPLKESCVVEGDIGRNPSNRLKMAVVRNGKSAKTKFVKLLESEKGEYELIGAKLYTGRTHQIRVHLGKLGRHIVGDHLYGFKSKRDNIDRVLLHAYILYLVHPVSGEKMSFLAPPHEDMMEIVKRDFEEEKVNEILDVDNFLRRFGDIHDFVRQ